MRLITYLFLTFMAFSVYAHEGDITPATVKEKLPSLMGASNVGTDFWVSVPPAYIQTSSPDDFIKFFIASAEETQVRITSPEGINRIVITKPNDVVEVNFTPGEAQPFLYYYNDGAAPGAQVYSGKGLNVSSDAPVVLYVVVRYRATSDGFLAIPTAVLGNEYIASPYSSRPISGTSLPNMVTVVGAYDNTTIDVTIGGDFGTQVPVQGGGFLESGDSRTWRINKGDVLVLSNQGDNQTVAGSSIIGDKPFALISGHYCADVPVGNHWCDYNGEMDLPVHAWGQHYHIPMVRDRAFNSVLRIFAKEDDTRIYRNGREVGVIAKGMGGIKGAGWLEMRVWDFGVPFETDIALISGDKPIYVMMYNAGIQEDQQAGVDDANSDPFSMVITPIEQYQTEIMFATPGVSGGAPFAENYLNIVYQTDENGLVPEDLEWGVSVGGEFQYESMRNFATLDDEYTSIGTSQEEWFQNSPFAANRYRHKALELPAVGVYSVRGSTPFAVYSYGYAWYDSYGFPTSAAVADLEIDDPIAPDITWEVECDGDVINGFIREQPINDDNRMSGIHSFRVTERVNYERMVVEDAVFENGKLKQQLFRADIIDPTQYGRIVFQAFDRANNDTTFVHEYFPEEFDLYAEVGEPGNIYDESYGDGQVYEDGQTATEYFILENTSDNRELEVRDIYLKFEDQGFELDMTSFELDGTPIPNFAFPFTLQPMERLRFAANYSADLAPSFSLDSIGAETCSEDRYFVQIRANKGGPAITVLGAETYPNTILPTIEEYQRTITVQNQCQGTQGTTVLRVTGYTGPANLQFRTDMPQQFEVPPGGEVTFNVFFESDGTPGLFEDFIVLETENVDENGEPTIGCDFTAELVAEVLNTSIRAQDYTYEPIDLYDFINGGTVPVIAGANADNEIPITVVNFGTANVDLAGGTVTTAAGSNNVFYFDAAAATEPVENDAIFDGKFAASLPANSEFVTRNVYFRPTTAGAFSFDYVIETAEGSNSPQHTISGEAYIANVTAHIDENDAESTGQVTFEEVSYPNVPATQNFYISNYKFSQDYTYGNTAEFNLTLDNISTDPNNPNAQFVLVSANVDGANYQITGDNHDYTLDPGQTMEFVVAFKAIDPNIDPADLTASITIANANTIDDATISGGPFNRTITFEAAQTQITTSISTENLGPICVGSPTNGVFTFANTSDVPGLNGINNITVNGVTVTPDDGNDLAYDITLLSADVKDDAGTVVNSYPANFNQIVLEPQQTLELSYEYIPNALIDPAKDMTFSVDYTPAALNPTLDIPAQEAFTITSIDIERDLAAGVIRINNEDVTIEDDEEFDPGDNFTFAVRLQDGDDMTEANITELNGTISYRRGYLVADYSSLRIAPDYMNDFEIVQGSVNIADNFVPRGNGKDNWIRTITFTVRSTNGTPVDLAGDIVELDFSVGLVNLILTDLPEGRDIESIYLARNSQGGDEFSSEVNSSLLLTDPNACGQINQPNPVTIRLSEDCAYAFRVLANTNEVNAISKVTPSPVTSQGAKIEFSLALGSNTTVKIYDMNGSLVATLADGMLNHGEHQFDIPVQDLNSGVYVYEIKSKYFEVSDEFILTK